MTTPKRQAYMLAYHAKHKEREKAARRARVRANPEKYQAQQRRYYYGVAPETATALLASQEHRCAICKADRPGGRGIWHLDHDHSDGQVRGFLCHKCNAGLGFFQDDPLLLELAAGYLRRCATLKERGSQADKVKAPAQ